MLNRRLGVVSLVSILIACSGCVGGRVSFSYYDDDPRPAKVVRVHKHTRHVHEHRRVCTRDCHDCYWDGTQVVIIEGHRHGPGCGHVWDGKHWVVVKKAKAKRAYPPAAKVTRIKRVP